jgi:hypothetical protein
VAIAIVMIHIVSACATAPPATAVPGAAPASIPKGYRLVMQGQQALYCRYEAPVGSSIRREYCLTAQQLQRQIDNVRVALESAEQDSLRRAARSAAAASPRPGR